MRRSLFIILFAFAAVGLFSQNAKSARKAVRSGNKAYNNQLYGAAEADYSKALEEDASSKEASFNLANAYYKQQRWDDALKEYQHYLTLEGENTEKMSSAWSNIGNTYLKKKANEKAENQATMGQPGATTQKTQQQDNLKMSMEAYKNALRLNPADDDTRYNLAVVQKMIKDKEDQNKDQNQDQKQDQKQDQNQDQQDQKNQDQKQDPKQDQKNQDQQQSGQMSQENMQQILQALEQDEKNTQERVNQAKAQERNKKNEQNRKQNKDW